jgi:hypothetical protein
VRPSFASTTAALTSIKRGTGVRDFKSCSANLILVRVGQL